MSEIELSTEQLEARQHRLAIRKGWNASATGLALHLSELEDVIANLRPWGVVVHAVAMFQTSEGGRYITHARIAECEHVSVESLRTAASFLSEHADKLTAEGRTTTPYDDEDAPTEAPHD